MTEHLLRAELSPVIYQPQQFRLSSGDPQEQTEFQGASCGVSKASGQPRAEQAVATRFTAENACPAHIRCVPASAEKSALTPGCPSPRIHSFFRKVQVEATYVSYISTPFNVYVSQCQ